MTIDRVTKTLLVLIVVGLFLNIRWKPSSVGASEGDYQISAVHSDASENGSYGDSVYVVNTKTGKVCHKGNGSGPSGISECPRSGLGTAPKKWSNGTRTFARIS